jgi:hypothetical protein
VLFLHASSLLRQGLVEIFFAGAVGFRSTDVAEQEANLRASINQRLIESGRKDSCVPCHERPSLVAPVLPRLPWIHAT